MDLAREHDLRGDVDVHNHLGYIHGQRESPRWGVVAAATTQRGRKKARPE
jgi:hypothetical protein